MECGLARWLCPVCCSRDKLLCCCAAQLRAMPAKSPHNLITSTAYLTDKPYEVQLGVLRWIRTLIAGVVDKAASEGSAAQHDLLAPLEHHEQLQGYSACKAGCEEESLVGIGVLEPEHEHHKEPIISRDSESNDKGINPKSYRVKLRDKSTPSQQ